MASHTGHTAPAARTSNAIDLRVRRGFVGAREDRSMARTYTCWYDDAGRTEECEAETAAEAAELYVMDGWDTPDPEDGTDWVDVWVRSPDGTEEVQIVTLDPDEPECDQLGGHDWRDTGAVGTGGAGVVCTEVCQRCGLERITRTHYQRSCDGADVGDHVRYRFAADE